MARDADPSSTQNRNKWTHISELRWCDYLTSRIELSGLCPLESIEIETTSPDIPSILYTHSASSSPLYILCNLSSQHHQTLSQTSIFHHKLSKYPKTSNIITMGGNGAGVNGNGFSVDDNEIQTDFITLTRFLTEEQSKLHEHATGDFTYAPFHPPILYLYQRRSWLTISC